MLHRWSRRGSAFSLLELVFVVAIIAILAAIAIPRLSRGTKGAADSALAGSLATLRGAIDHYAAEHGGSLPKSSKVAEQLTTYTDSEGDPQASRDATHIWGPYLQAIPPLPVGANKGKTDVKQVDAVNVGWIYDPTTGTIRANCLDMEVDDAGRKYKDY
jgi:prepilin-type N-terminal cleavage/methylation domain-containing protein